MGLPMPTEKYYYGQEAFELIERLERLSTPEAVIEAVQAVVGRFGFEFFCFNTFPRPPQKFDEVMLASKLPPEWLKLYIEQDYAHVDPTIRWCKQTIHPFEWKDAPYDPEREPRAAELVQRATEFGLSRGFWVPIPGPKGTEGGVWMGGARPELTAASKRVIHFIGLYTFDRLRRTKASAPRAGPSLTGREREVLSWAARGKSAWEIGEILSIAKRTVDEHAQSAFRKLNAVNRTQAVALALLDHLIEV